MVQKYFDMYCYRVSRRISRGLIMISSSFSLQVMQQALFLEEFLFFSCTILRSTLTGRPEGFT